ncbi:MAG: carboxymuconolactone decarboxylase family protein [Salinigranum sp.]
MATEAHTQENYERTRAKVEETLGIVPGFFDALNEEDLVNEWPNFERYTFGETAIPPKYRELIGLAVAANIKCPYCQAFHTKAARMHGATEEELSELYFLASYTARYSALIHAQHYDMDVFEDELAEIEAHLHSQMDAGAD